MTKLDSALLSFELRHLPKTLGRSRALARDRDGTFSRSCARRESPQPDANDGCDDERHPAYSHRDLVIAHLHRNMIDQSDHVSDCKESKKDARDT